MSLSLVTSCLSFTSTNAKSNADDKEPKRIYSSKTTSNINITDMDSLSTGAAMSQNPYSLNRIYEDDISFSDIIQSNTDISTELQSKLNGSKTDTSLRPPSYTSTNIDIENCDDGDFTGIGSGTDDNPYLINTKTDLYCMAHMVNNGYSTITDVWSLTDNITLDSNSDIDKSWTDATGQWKPIGTFDFIGSGADNKPFFGSLYGGNHYVSGIYVDNSPISQGLLGFADDINTISDIGIRNSYIKGDVAVGGLVGSADTLNTISNCYNKANVYGKINFVGGLVGYAYGTINIISKSYNDGKISGYSNIGGLVGCAGNALCTISDSHNSGDIFGTDDNVAGLVGAIVSEENINGSINTIFSSYNSGTISCSPGEYDVPSGIGGLIGLVGALNAISFSYNAGNVSGGVMYFGGLIGYVYAISDFSNCYNQSNIFGQNFGGGLIGYVFVVTYFSNVYNIGNVFCEHSTGYIGGLVGKIHKALSTISDIYNYGDVSGTVFVGGLIGVIDDVFSLSNSYDTGNVSGTNYVGGLIGWVDDIFNTFSNSYNQGNISGANYVGGLIAHIAISNGETHGTIQNTGVFSPNIKGEDSNFEHILVGTITNLSGVTFTNNYYYSVLKINGKTPTTAQKQNAIAVGCNELTNRAWWNSNITKDQSIWNTQVVAQYYYPILKIQKTPKTKLPTVCLPNNNNLIKIKTLKIKVSKKKIDITISFSNSIKNAKIYIYFKNKKVGKYYKVKNNHIIIKGTKKVKKFYKALKKAVKKTKKKYKKKKKYLITFKYSTAKKSIKIKTLY